MRTNQNVEEAGNGLPEFLDNGNKMDSAAQDELMNDENADQPDEDDDEYQEYRRDEEEDMQDDQDDEESYRVQEESRTNMSAQEQDGDRDEDDEGDQARSSSDNYLKHDQRAAADPSKPYNRVTYDEWHKHDEQHPEVEEQEDEDVEIKEEVYDFDDYSFEELWKQKSWDILNLLYYNVEAGPFLADISRDTLGDDFDDYVAVINTPITFQMVKQKCIRHMYLEPVQFIDDMNLVFDNCMKYNEIGSSFHNAAKKLKKILHTQVKKKKLVEHQWEHGWDPQRQAQRQRR